MKKEPEMLFKEMGKFSAVWQEFLLSTEKSEKNIFLQYELKNLNSTSPEWLRLVWNYTSPDY